jgi:hypothetical protein
MAKKKASIAQPYDNPSTNPNDLAALYAKFGIDVKKPTSEASRRGLSLIGDALGGDRIDMEMAAKRLKEGESYAPGAGLGVIRMERVGTTGISGGGRDGMSRTSGTRELAVYGRVAPAPAPAPPPPAPAPSVTPPRPSGELQIPQGGFGGFGPGTASPGLEPAKVNDPTPPPQFLMPGMSQVVRNEPADVRRRRSVARQSGQTRLGTGQLRRGSRAGSAGRSTGVTPGRLNRSTGLNIGGSDLQAPGLRPMRNTGLAVGGMR